jgi:predicted transporter
MNVVVLTAGKQHAAVVSAGPKTGAILIGIAFLGVVYVAIGLITGHWSLKQLFSGFDGFGSTSKLQWLLWLIVILYGYVVHWVLRAENSDFKVPKPAAPDKPPAKTTGGISQDDSGGPELAKIQLMAFTLIGIGVFLTRFSTRSRSATSRMACPTSIRRCWC